MTHQPDPQPLGDHCEPWYQDFDLEEPHCHAHNLTAHQHAQPTAGDLTRSLAEHTGWRDHTPTITFLDETLNDLRDLDVSISVHLQGFATAVSQIITALKPLLDAYTTAKAHDLHHIKTRYHQKRR